MNNYGVEKRKPRVKSSRNNSEPDKDNANERSYEEQVKGNMVNIALATQENPEQDELIKINQYRTTVSAGLKQAGKSAVFPGQQNIQIFDQIPLKRAELNAQIETHAQYQQSNCCLTARDNNILYSPDYSSAKFKAKTREYR